MPTNTPYRTARRIAAELVERHDLSPPFDLAAYAERFADVIFDADLPVRCDAATFHGALPGDRPTIVLPRSDYLQPRRRFALAHALGHLFLGWHPLGTPCDVADQPSELPITVHDLVEGEANVFARELLAPQRWITSFDALDRPADLVRHVAERAGIPLMPAARQVASLLAPGSVWAVIDSWDDVVDSGRSPGTTITPPAIGTTLDGRYARAAERRERAKLSGLTIVMWYFSDERESGLARDVTARDLLAVIGGELGRSSPDVEELIARLDGVAGWANEQVGTASIDGMASALRSRLLTIDIFTDVRHHPQFNDLVQTKAVELVAKRLART